MRRRRWLLIGLLAIPIVALAAALPALRGLGRASAAGDVPLYEVERGEFSRTVHAEGVLEAAEVTPLGPPPQVRQGVKIAWLAPDGSHVSKDEVVIRFDPTDMEKNLEDGQHDRATADSRIQQKTIREQGAQHNLERDATLAGLEMEHASEFQSKDPDIFSRVEIIESEIDHDLASARKSHASAVKETRGEVAKAEVGLLAVERRKADLKISQATTGLAGLEVRAPHDGIFVLRSDWGRTPAVGQVVWGGNTLAEIPRLEKMQAKVHVLEADAGGLREGLSATLRLEAHPETIYRATVKKVDTLAQPRNFRAPVQYFGVMLELERTDAAVMKLGQRVRATLSLDELHDVLTVPRQAIVDREGKNVVFVHRGGSFEPVEVVLGPAALGRVVVERGVAAGDHIALRDPTRPAAAPASGDEKAKPSAGGGQGGGGRRMVVFR